MVERRESRTPTNSQYSPYYDNRGVSLYLSQKNIDGNLAPTTALRFGSPLELRLVDNPNFRYSRLETYIRTSFGPNNTTVYIFDDHNLALFGWCEAFLEGRLEAGATLKHYDEHCDGDKPPTTFLEQEAFLKGLWTLAEAATYARSIPCSDFIHPAIHMGLVTKFDWFSAHYRGLPRHEFDDFSQVKYRMVGTVFSPYCYGFTPPPPEEKIVDIDLDYFDRMENLETIRHALDIMRADMADAGVVTLATSPGYIEPQKAVSLVQQLLLDHSPLPPTPH